MKSWRGLTTLAMVIAMAMACSKKQDTSDQDQDSGTAPYAALENVIYSYQGSGPCGANSYKVWEFSGNDLKDPVFTSIANAPKERFEAAHVCKSALIYSGETRLKLRKSDGSTEILASPDLGCGQAASPDLTGIIPQEVMDELQEALQPRSYNFSQYLHNNVAVYFLDERLADADVASFEVNLSGGYAQDKAHVFFQQKTLEGVDRSSFIALTGGWAKDQYHAYYNATIVEGADVQTLTVDRTALDYASDARQVYFRGKVIAGFDPQSFACINSRFCRNNSQVLFINSLVADADAASFAVDSCDYSYSQAPTASLCAVSPPKPTKLICHVHDKNHSFVLEHTDAATMY